MTHEGTGPHLRVLDGWRGVSILFVLAAHLLPLFTVGNKAIGVLGMVLFFNLSGFLITTFLLRRGASVVDFLIRRIFRIVPLAWLFFAVVCLFQDETLQSWVAHYLFYANLPPPRIRLMTDHIWSLCVEMQFYVGVALLFALLRRRGLLLLPVLALAFTSYRIAGGVTSSSITWYCIDEILAGCTLALVHHDELGRVGRGLKAWMGRLPQGPLFLLVALSSISEVDGLQWLNYLRPYLAALLVGATLNGGRTRIVAALDRRPLRYLASVSYAVYVIHGGLTHSWFGSGEVVEKYLKRPLLLVVLFLLAHASTFYFERPFIAFGRRLSAMLAPRAHGSPRVNP